MAAVVGISDLIAAWGYRRVDVMYGFDCKLPTDQLWQVQEVETSGLDGHIERSIRDGIFLPGLSDIHIEDLETSFGFKLCHESDLHFESTQPWMVEQVVACWRAQGFALFMNAGPSANPGTKEWKRLT